MDKAWTAKAGWTIVVERDYDGDVFLGTTNSGNPDSATGGRVDRTTAKEIANFILEVANMEPIGLQSYISSRGAGNIFKDLCEDLKLPKEEWDELFKEMKTMIESRILGNL